MLSPMSYVTGFENNWLPHTIINIYKYSFYKAVADGPVGQVLAGPPFLKTNKVPFYRKQVINKSARVIFGLVQLVILRYAV